MNPHLLEIVLAQSLSVSLGDFSASSGRHAYKIEARAVLCWALFNRLGWSLQRIAARYGYGHHGSILNLVAKFRYQLRDSPAMQAGKLAAEEWLESQGIPRNRPDVKSSRLVYKKHRKA